MPPLPPRVLAGARAVPAAAETLMRLWRAQPQLEQLEREQAGALCVSGRHAGDRGALLDAAASVGRMRRCLAARASLDPGARGRLAAELLLCDQRPVAEIRISQESTGPAIAPAAFQALAESLGLGARRSWTPDAVAALQCAVESDVAVLLENALLLAIHRGDWADAGVGASDLDLASDLASPPSRTPSLLRAPSRVAIPPIAFRRLLTEIAQDLNWDQLKWDQSKEWMLVGWMPGTEDALHLAAERHIVEVFRVAGKVAVHAGRKVIQPKDLQLARRVRNARA